VGESPETWSPTIDRSAETPSTDDAEAFSTPVVPDGDDEADSATLAAPSLSPMVRWASIGAAAAVVVALDQVTKWWARGLDRPIDLIGSLRFNLAFNSGAAFSRFEGWGSLIGVAGVVIVVVLLRFSLQLTSRAGAVCMGVVVGGALGNLIDRMVQPGDGFFGGKVTDFIDLQWWPIFNVADIALTVGGLLLVLTGMRRSPGGS
jgi:signal peptidase II